MWSDFHDAGKPRERPWSEAPTNTLWVFSGGCSSVLQREVLIQNVKKKFWNLWRKYKKRRRKNKFLLKKKHHDKALKRKEQQFYSFLEETEFCGFDRFSRILEEANRIDPVQEMLTEKFNTKEEFLFNNEYQCKFSKLIRYCFDIEITIINQLNLEELMQQIEEFGVGGNLDPIESSSQKVDNKINPLTKSNNLQFDSNSKNLNIHSTIEANQDDFEKFTNNEKSFDKFLMTMKFEEDKLHKMIRNYKTTMRKQLIKIIRIMTECILKKGGSVRLILCNEIEYIMFEFFAELLIKFIIYQRTKH
jgi:hypothetical protein